MKDNIHPINKFAYYTPYWFLILIPTTLMNLSFVLDGHVAMGLVLQLCHVPWLVRLIQLKGWKHWYGFREVYKDEKND